MGHLSNDVLSEWALDIEASSSLGLNPRAVDEVFVLYEHKRQIRSSFEAKVALLTTLLKLRLPC